MLTKRLRQRKQQKKKISKKKKTSLDVQHTFFVHFFAVVLHDDSVKLPETSQLHVFWRKCCVWSCSLFFTLPLIFTLVAASISHFLTAAIKFSCYSSNKIGLLCILISGSSSFSVIHVNAEFKIKSKKKNRCRCCCFLLPKRADT